MEQPPALLQGVARPSPKSLFIQEVIYVLLSELGAPPQIRVIFSLFDFCPGPAVFGLLIKLFFVLGTDVADIGITSVDQLANL